MQSIPADRIGHPLSPDIAYSTLYAPAVLLFADDELRRSRIGRLIFAAGGRLVAADPLSGALARIDRQVGRLHVVADLREDRGAELDLLLARLDAAGTTRSTSLVIAPPDLIDPIATRITDPAVAVLIDPTDADIAEGLSALLLPVDETLSDSGGDTNTQRLAQLSEEVGRIARTLAVLSSSEELARATESPPPSEIGAMVDMPDIPLVRTLIRLRRLREQHFEPTLFADPAWDMLLDLVGADCEQRSVAVSSLCIAASVPPTTALRWIAAMTEQGLFRRQPDPDDGRRVFIVLTDDASAAMAAYLAGVRRLLAVAS